MFKFRVLIGASVVAVLIAWFGSQALPASRDALAANQPFAVMLPVMVRLEAGQLFQLPAQVLDTIETPTETPSATLTATPTNTHTHTRCVAALHDCVSLPKAGVGGKNTLRGSPFVQTLLFLVFLLLVRLSNATDAIGMHLWPRVVAMLQKMFAKLLTSR